MSFTPFYFDGNQWFGVVDTPAAWQSLAATYLLDRLLSATKAPQSEMAHLPERYFAGAPGVLRGSLPSFGFRREHQAGTLTLGEWARARGMDLRALADQRAQA